MPTVYHAGYADQGAEIHRLMELLPDLIMIDVRKSPRSYKPEWGGFMLSERYNKDKQHKRYWQEGNTLGNINYLPQDRWKGHQLVDEKTGMRRLAGALRNGHDLLLICQCPKDSGCHRGTIIKQLFFYWKEHLEEQYGRLEFCDAPCGVLLASCTPEERARHDECWRQAVEMSKEQKESPEAQMLVLEAVGILTNVKERIYPLAKDYTAVLAQAAQPPVVKRTPVRSN